MRLLKHIEDIPFIDDTNTWKRFASRAVVFDDNNLIPILFVSKFSYHNLPGGGIDGNESEKDAAKREIKEETGCKIEIEREVGMITERRKELNFDQTSYCFLGKIIEKGKQYLEQGEIDDGVELVWMTLDKAIETFKNDKPQNYGGKFIRQRDLTFLEEAKRLTSSTF